MSEKRRDYSGHEAPAKAIVVSPDKPVHGTGHPAPARVDPVNVAPNLPPPKRDDAGSSGRPPK